MPAHYAKRADLRKKLKKVVDNMDGEPEVNR